MPAGLIDAADAGEVSSSAADQPGLRLSHSLRLRWDMSDRISAIVHGVSPMGTGLVDVRKHRRMGMMVDYFPIQTTGFFLSAGFRKSPARTRWAPGATSTVTPIFAPINSEPLRVATNIARRSPAMMAGWAGMIGDEASLGFSAGAMQEHGRATRVSSAAIARSIHDNASWSRVGALAQVNLAVRF